MNCRNKRKYLVTLMALLSILSLFVYVARSDDPETVITRLIFPDYQIVPTNMIDDLRYVKFTDHLKYVDGNLQEDQNAFCIQSTDNIGLINSVFKPRRLFSVSPAFNAYVIIGVASNGNVYYYGTVSDDWDYFEVNGVEYSVELDRPERLKKVKCP